MITGSKLGSYQITGAIGAGGMGEVYQAHDTRLERNVAIKVLPEAFAHDIERLSRFEREAKMLAALNHPNIATIYGIEQSNGTSYLVMELVSGETLAERIEREGAVPVEEALTIARQIAEALEAAHEKGIIHRDLKPANVKVTPEGKVKVLDFGLAKAFADDGANESPSNSPTLSMAATMQGVILGTAAYMSPEQARGKAVNRATDIWAFGCVLYELLTGKQTFHGEDVTDILAAVVKTDPDWTRLPDATPPAIRVMLRRCLQKERRQRLQDATDVRIEIEEALAAPSAGPTAAAPVKQGWQQALVLALTVLVATVAVGFVVWNLKPTPPRLVTRTVITLPPGQQLAGLDDGPAVALSPDGTNLAYVAIQGGTQQLYLRPLDSLEARPVPGTEGASNPFFSPGGQWVGFLANGKVKKVSVSGGAPVTLTDGARTSGASWSSQGIIAFAPDENRDLQQVSDAGGAPQSLTRSVKEEAYHLWPDFLPGGKAVLFDTAPGGLIYNLENAQIAVQPVGTGERRNLIKGGTQPRYAASGHLIYAQGGSLIAAPFNPQQLTVTGAAVPVVQGILQSSVTGSAQYSLSPTGSLAYVSGSYQPEQSKLVWVSRNGAEQPLAAPARAYRGPRLSPDGRRVVVYIVDEETQLWLYDLSRETLTRFTFVGNFNSEPVWTPDGKRIAFNSTKEGPQNIFWQLADGSGGLERLTTSENAQAPMSWSPDGQLLAYRERTHTTQEDILVLHMGDPSAGSGQSRKAQPFLSTPFNESAPSFSPDGRWIAYVSNESGRNEIYAQPYPGPGAKWQISTEGGTEPVWNRNGRELFYRSGEKMMAVDIAAQPSFTVGKPRMLFEGPYLPTPGTFPYYDVSPDGQRFLMIKPSEKAEAAPTQINVVLNWFEELKQRVPAGK